MSQTYKIQDLACAHEHTLDEILDTKYYEDHVLDNTP